MGFLQMEVPQNRWFIRNYPIKMGDLGVLMETSYLPTKTKDLLINQHVAIRHSLTGHHLVFIQKGLRLIWGCWKFIQVLVNKAG